MKRFITAFLIVLSLSAGAQGSLSLDKISTPIECRTVTVETSVHVEWVLVALHSGYSRIFIDARLVIVSEEERCDPHRLTWALPKIIQTRVNGRPVKVVMYKTKEGAVIL